MFKFLIKHNYPGKYRLYKFLLNVGLLKNAVSIEYYDFHFLMPADQWVYWKNSNLERYQPKRLATLNKVINDELHFFDLIDLGADIGIVSGNIYKNCPRLQYLVAIEPNPMSFLYLEKNIARLNIDRDALNIAASDFEGKVLLIFDSTRQSDHSGYIDPSTGGHTVVRTVDDFYSPKSPDLVMKIDVEGQEKSVLRGAVKTIGLARRVVFYLEIHRSVIERTGVSAEAIFEQAELIRNFQWFLSEPNRPEVDRSRPFFDQFPEVGQHDVIGLSDG